MKGIFITGTGTNIGKTFFTYHLFNYLRSQNIQSVAFKPIQTGFNKKYNSDLKLIYQNSTPEQLLFAENHQYRLTAPCSPHLAAEIDIKPAITVDNIMQKMQSIPSGTFQIVEGAGGILVPINESETILDLIHTLKMPTIIVSTGTLGSINHTMLSINALKQKKAAILGFAFSDKHNIALNQKCACKTYINIKIQFSIKNTIINPQSNQNNQIPAKQYQNLCNNCLQKVIFCNNANTISKMSNIPFIGYLPFLTCTQTTEYSNYINQQLLTKQIQ